MPQRIVFVCTGNTCRSPLAEAVARRRYADLHLIFASAGTHVVPGQTASGGSLAFAAEIGLSLEDHRSRPLSAPLLDGTAWLIGMTRSHAAVLSARISADWSGAIGVLGAPGHDWRWQGPASRSEEIADPWGTDDDVYRQVGRRIERLVLSWGHVFCELH